MRPLLLAFLAGLVSALGFQPLGLWPLTLLAFAGLLWLIETAPGMRAALARGWLFGLGQFVLGLNWIATAFTYQAAMPAWLGWIAVVLLSFYLAVYPAMASGLAWRWGRPNRAALVLVLAAGWIVTEWLRGTVFTGFPWNPAGVALIDTGAAGAARWVGTYGLSGLALLAAGALYLLARRSGRGALLSVAAPVFLLVVGAQLAAGSGPGLTDTPLRIVQPNIGQQNKWDPDFERENFARLARATGTPGPAPRLVLWPEVAVPDLVEQDPFARRRIAALVGAEDIVLTGASAVDFEDGRLVAVYNSLFALDGAGGRILGRYDKAHLTPYGEYLPMRPLLSSIGLSRLAPGDIDTEPGPGPATLDLGRFGQAGIQICYEIVFSGAVVDRAARPDFLFNPSNDAWFGYWGPPQHLAQARLRAIEEGLPVIRSTPTGISAVVDADGRLLASLGWREEGAIDALLPAARPPTPFARWGNALPFLFAGLLAIGAIAVRSKAV